MNILLDLVCQSKLNNHRVVGLTLIVVGPYTFISRHKIPCIIFRSPGFLILSFGVFHKGSESGCFPARGPILLGTTCRGLGHTLFGSTSRDANPHPRSLRPPPPPAPSSFPPNACILPQVRRTKGSFFVHEAILAQVDSVQLVQARLPLFICPSVHSERRLLQFSRRRWRRSHSKRLLRIQRWGPGVRGMEVGGGVGGVGLALGVGRIGALDF